MLKPLPSAPLTVEDERIGLRLWDRGVWPAASWPGLLSADRRDANLMHKAQYFRAFAGYKITALCLWTEDPDAWWIDAGGKLS